MGMRELYDKFKERMEDDPDSCGDKHLDYLRKQKRLRSQAIEKKILKASLERTQKQKFKKMVRPTMITGKYKKKFKSFKF